MKKIIAGALIALCLAVGITAVLSMKTVWSLLAMFAAGVAVVLILNKTMD